MATDYDINRATHVQNEYRYVTKTNPAVKARNSGAREVTLFTQLNGATADALATQYLADNAAPLAFEIVLEGIVFLDSFVGGPPSFIPNFPKFATDGRAMKVVSYASDIDANTTTIQVRG
ncbi:hypothetical protein IFT54_05515 [Sphingomonas sp. CFBP 13714]|uniref:hypothetical protein n=1 Tax=Sphingomonas sp. CFBP 13714 TaxID=2775308 RepID=UPI00177F1C8D|nr:hypothetical protein [Sphingomonas sp. CFBP 13714]MBD8699273.1 hypothetical protein [Sphingomonas sp. CFBP 13714]